LSDTLQVKAGVRALPDVTPGLSQGELIDAYGTHSRAVRSVAARTCGPAQADDVVQEVFFRLWQEPGRFDPAKGSLRGYLLGIGRNCAVDVVRSNQARLRREQRVVAVQATPAPSVVDLVEGLDVAERVCAALALLPDAERLAITMAFFGGLSYRATAVRLNVPEGTTKSRIRVGLRRLAQLLDDDDAPPTGTADPPLVPTTGTALDPPT